MRSLATVRRLTQLKTSRAMLRSYNSIPALNYMFNRNYSKASSSLMGNFGYRNFNTRNTGRFRNTFRGKKVFVKPHNVIKDDVMFSMTPHRAVYEENDNTITLSRLGYLTFDFIPYEMTSHGKRGNYQERDTFIMTMKNVGDFLKIDDTYKEDEEPVILNYTPFMGNQSQENAKVKVLKIEK